MLSLFNIEGGAGQAQSAFAPRPRFALVRHSLDLICCKFTFTVAMVMFKVCGVAVYRRECPRMLQNILGRFHLVRSAFLARQGKV